jgi:hypothetical protein
MQAAVVVLVTLVHLVVREAQAVAVVDLIQATQLMVLPILVVALVAALRIMAAHLLQVVPESSSFVTSRLQCNDLRNIR